MITEYHDISPFIWVFFSLFNQFLIVFNVWAFTSLVRFFLGILFFLMHLKMELFSLLPRKYTLLTYRERQLILYFDFASCNLTEYVYLFLLVFVCVCVWVLPIWGHIIFKLRQFFSFLGFGWPLFIFLA